MAGELCCVDTNILFYALDASQGAKHDQAVRLLELMYRNSGIFLLQTLSELCNAIGRKRPELLPVTTQFVHRTLRLFPVSAALPGDLPTALLARDKHQLAFWDAMLWATAQRAGCSVLLSEDFQDGRRLGGVRFRNPFLMTDTELVAYFR